MTSFFWNKAAAWGQDDGRVLPINRPGGGLLTAKEALDLSKEEATWRTGLRGFRRSELPGADLCIHRRGAYFRVEWILAGRETGFDSQDARQSIAFLLLEAPKGVPGDWMALETWCRHPGSPGLDDRQGEVKRRVEAYLLAFIEHWADHPEQRPVLAALAKWPAAFSVDASGQIDLRASAINLGIHATWNREDAANATDPIQKSIADMRSEVGFWSGPFLADRSARWVTIPSDWLTQAAGWLECTSIDLEGEWGQAYYQGLTLRLALYRAIAGQMKDFLAASGREDVNTEFITSVCRGNPSAAMRNAWADQVLAFAGDRAGWLEDQVRLSRTKAQRDDNYIPKWRRKAMERAEQERQRKATAHTQHLRVDDETARWVLGGLAATWGKGDPFVGECIAQLEAGALERDTDTWRALYNQHLHQAGQHSAFTREQCAIPGQLEGLKARIQAAIASQGFWAAKASLACLNWDLALDDPEAQDRALDALVGTESDLGTWCRTGQQGRWANSVQFVDAGPDFGLFSRRPPDGHWSPTTFRRWDLAANYTPQDEAAKAVTKALGRAV